MKTKFKNIALIGPQNSPDVATTIAELITHLTAYGSNIILEEETAAIFTHYDLPASPRDKLLQHNCELIIVIGGDGSILNAAQAAARQNLPLVGINRGHLGFLSDIASAAPVKITEILMGQFYEESRSLLAITMVDPENNICTTKRALNDVVFLARSGGLMLDFAVYVEPQFLCNYHADGLIIATPTGSTAHALSSGGPILHPELAGLVLVPMLSHNLSSRPIVIDNSRKIKVVFNAQNPGELLLRCDGRGTPIPPGATITVSHSQEKLRLLHPLDYNYFDTLRTKLHWETKYKVSC